MRWPIVIVCLMLLSACTPEIIDDTHTHLLLKVDGMNDGVMEKANRMAMGRCESYGLEPSAPTVHETGFIFPKAWYIEYDCIAPDR